MADPVTDNYSLVLPTVGADGGLWGGILNNGDISPIDTILGGNFPVTINAADVNLSTAQFQNAIFVLSGVLTGNRSLIVPLSPNSATLACGGRFVVVNNTTGNFNVTVKTAAAGSVGVTVPQGFSAFLYSDKTNVGYASTGLPGFAAAVNGNPNTQLAGTAGSATTNASLAFDYTNGVLYVCTTTGNAAAAVWTVPVATVPRGFDTVVNLSLVVTHTGGNLLNVAAKTAAGTDATVVNPIVVPFQTVSAGNTTGGRTTRNVTGALSMDTNAIGASLGTSASVPFRIWFALFNNAGTPVLAMQVCSTASAIYPLAEYGVASTVAVGVGATSAGVWYTPNGTTLTNCAFRVIGYCEYTAGLVTPGTYNSDPNSTVLFGPGIKKPGDIVQAVYSTSGSAVITPTSAINLVKYSAAIGATVTNSSSSITFKRNAVTLASQSVGVVSGTAIILQGSASEVVLDAPASTAAQTYSVAASVGGGTSTSLAEEIMG